MNIKDESFKELLFKAREEIISRRDQSSPGSKEKRNYRILAKNIDKLITRVEELQNEEKL